MSLDETKLKEKSERGDYFRANLKVHTRQAGFDIDDCPVHGSTIEPSCSECKKTLDNFITSGELRRLHDATEAARRALNAPPKPFR